MREELRKNRDYSDKIIITQYSDPICTWCWGVEPILRKLELNFPNEIEFRYVMGGLVEDYRQMAGENISAEEFNKVIGKHTLEAYNKHKMPVNPLNYNVFSDDLPGSFPQNIAYKAAEIASPQRAEKFLYLIRLATLAQGIKTNKDVELMKLAIKAGVDIDRYMEALDSGEAEAAFNADRFISQSVGVQGFPTFEIKYNQEKYLIRGYTEYNTFLNAILEISKSMVFPIKVEKTEENILNLIKNREILSIEEIRMAFNFVDENSVKEALKDLIKNNKIEIETMGNGEFVKYIQENNVCGFDGMC